MYTYKDLKAQFPQAYACGGEVIARLEGKNVVLASLGNGSFQLTEAGQAAMRDVQIVESAPVEAPKGKSKAKAKAEPTPEPVDEVDLGDIDLG